MVPLRYNVAETGVTVTPENATSPQQGLMEASHAVSRDPFSAGVPAAEGRAENSRHCVPLSRVLKKGLATSRNLAEVNGGSVDVESTKGEGATFTVRLPLDTPLA